MTRRLLDALARGQRRINFTCPVSDIALTMRQPAYADRLAAELGARERWTAAVNTHADRQSLADLTRALLIGRCLFEADQDEPIGEAILDIGEDALEAYDAVLESIELPPAEAWTEDAVDGMVELIKKKDPTIAASLKISAGSTAFALLHSLADRLSSSATPNSSPSSPDTTSTTTADDGA